MSRQELEGVVEELKDIKGSQTELISVYIPADQDLNSVRRQMEDEKGTAENIKQKGTRKNVISALDSIGRFLKRYKQTPENGLAIFCGNVSDSEGKSEIDLWDVEPPKPLNTRLYRCDKEFVLEPLEEQLEADEVYGLVVMDRKEATFGLLEGKRVKVLRHMTSGVPGKQRAGGQSSQRFSRKTETMAKKFFKRVADTMKDLFWERDKLKGIIIGGPMPTKEDFLKKGQLNEQLKEMIIGKKDLGYTDESGLELLVEKCQDILEEQEIMREKQLLEEFFRRLGKDLGAAYKEEDIQKSLKYGAAEKILLSKKLDKPKIAKFTREAKNISAEVEIVSVETEEGKQFWNIGGMGALLRFEV